MRATVDFEDVRGLHALVSACLLEGVRAAVVPERPSLPNAPRYAARVASSDGE